MIDTTELRGLIQANEMAGWSQLSFRHSYLLELADRIDQLEEQAKQNHGDDATALPHDNAALRRWEAKLLEDTADYRELDPAFRSLRKADKLRRGR